MGVQLRSQEGKVLAMSEMDPTLKKDVMLDRLQEARERWLGSTAMSADALEALQDIDALLDKANAEGISLGVIDAA